MNNPSTDGNDPPREPLLFLHGSIVTAIVVCAGLYFLKEYVLTFDAGEQMTRSLAFVPGRAQIAGGGVLAVLNAVTCSLLHASLPHLSINMICLAAFGSPLAERIGAARFAFFWVFTALCSTALHFVTHIGDATPLVGASGVVSGAMGAAARFGFATTGKQGPREFAGAPLSLGDAARNNSVISFVLAWALVNFLSGAGMALSDGVSVNIAWEAHIGGFLAGFLGLKLFVQRPVGEM